jgi:hypothetical protein
MKTMFAGYVYVYTYTYIYIYRHSHNGINEIVFVILL